MDFRQHLIRQIVFSRATFGPGERTEGVTDHITKELGEIAAEHAPMKRAKEWVDVAILGLDGLWRAVEAGMGGKPPADAVANTMIEMIVSKQRRNELREWPDWRTADPAKAIEHVRDGDGRP